MPDAEIEGGIAGRAEAKELVAQSKGGPESRPIAAFLGDDVQLATNLLRLGAMAALPKGLAAIGVILVVIAPPLNLMAGRVDTQLNAQFRQGAVRAERIDGIAKLGNAGGIGLDFDAHRNDAAFGAEKLVCHSSHDGAQLVEHIAGTELRLKIGKALPGMIAIAIDAVVKGRRAEEIPTDGVVKELSALILELGDSTIGSIDLEGEKIGHTHGDNGGSGIVGVDHLGGRNGKGVGAEIDVVEIGHLELVVAILGENPRSYGIVRVVDLVAIASEIETDEDTLAWKGVELGHAETKTTALSGREMGMNGIGINAIAMGRKDLVMADEIVGIAEIEIVMEGIVLFAGGEGDLADIEILIDLLDLVGMGMGFAIAADYAVGAESIVVADAWQAAQIATHGIPGNGRLDGSSDGIVGSLDGENGKRGIGGAGDKKTLVDPIPDEATLKLGILADGIPIIF